jgi:stage V sporulation protein G
VEITDVRVHPVDDEKLRAYVSVVLDGCFMVNDIKVVSGRDGLFISMPSRKRKNGEYRDVAHPLNQETRRRFEERILAESERALAAAGGSVDGAPAGDAAPGTGRLATAAAAVVMLSSLPADLPPNPLDELERKHSADGFWGVE